MKKSTIFKILTFFLTFVIFSCCSGCFVESCIGSCMDKQEAKDKAEFLERARVKKAEADSFIPQVDDYILELKLRTCFESNEEAYSEGFFNLYDPGAGMYNYNFGYTHSEEKTIIAIIYQIPNYNRKYEFKYSINDVCGYEFFFDPNRNLFLDGLIEYDQKLFAVPYIDGSRWNDRNCRIHPPALYMIDVENEQILYCGYFEEWYEELFNNYSAKGSYDYYYKITKKISEETSNEEN